MRKRIRKNNSDYRLEMALKESFKFFSLVQKGHEDLPYGHLSYHDVEDSSPLFDCDIFSPLVEFKSSRKQLITVKDAIDDLHEYGAHESDYVKCLNSQQLSGVDKSKIKPTNTELRKNSTKVQARFRLYQLMNKLPPKARRDIGEFLRTGLETSDMEKALRELCSAGQFMTVDGEKFDDLSWRGMRAELTELKTKKHTQRALVADQPAPAALSIPDDACHYHEETLRNSHSEGNGKDPVLS